MIYGIPYFGIDTNNIIETILKKDINSKFNIETSLYELIKNSEYKKLIVVVDNKWITYLHDIIFNYRDKQCYISYYTYKTFQINNKYRSDNKGHLIVNDRNIYIRYEYKLEQIKVDLGVSIVLFDLNTETKYKVNITKWYNNKTFSIEDLYTKYINSCYKEDDELLSKYDGGYHYINKEIAGFRNKERRLREEYELEAYDKDSNEQKDFRDVRQFKVEEVLKLKGINYITIDNYKLRRLKFESLLYCILREEAIPVEEEFKQQFTEKLGKQCDYIKYGNNIKLIIKSYWLNNYKQIRQRTWSRHNIV